MVAVSTSWKNAQGSKEEKHKFKLGKDHIHNTNFSSILQAPAFAVVTNEEDPSQRAQRRNQNWHLQVHYLEEGCGCTCP
jgi:hypothetical protein